MNVKDVRERVQRLRDNHGDDEGAHAREDELHRDVLGAIADGHPDASDLATEALMTTEIEFCRWYA